MKFIPYARQCVDDHDIDAVVRVLRSDWLTTGPIIDRFEQSLETKTHASHAVALSSGTAALHATMAAFDVQPGDEVIVPAMTFAATANCVLYQGGRPVFADIDPCTLLIDPEDVEAKITPRTRGIIAVDYAGQPCDYETLRAITERHGLFLVADACHSLGARLNGIPVGTLADATVFSFHPVKQVTCGEGGAVVTNDENIASRIRRFRNHGITTEPRHRRGKWFYEMVDLGYNYRISDIHCALGVSQLSKLEKWLRHRRELARNYDSAFSDSDCIQPLEVKPNVEHAYHLYVVRFERSVSRDNVYDQLRNRGIGVNVHYVPTYLHPYYRDRLGATSGLCPNAERAYSQILSLPMFAALAVEEQAVVIENTLEIVDRVRRFAA